MAKKKSSSKSSLRLHPVSLGLSVGLLWGIGVAITTISSLKTGYLAGLFQLLTGMYPGYAVSWGGAVSGLVFGFIDGFVGGWLMAWLYNKFTEKCC